MSRADDIEHLRARLNGKRWVWAERPTLLHDRSDRAGQCPCGCESWSGEPAELVVPAPASGELDDAVAALVARSPSVGRQPIAARWTDDARSSVTLTVDAWDRGALLVETIPGPELLIDRWTGARHHRDEQSELDGSLAAFDRLKRSELVEHIIVPRRTYREQLVAMVARPKVLGVFGGARGGKTQTLAEMAEDAWFELGGKGVRFWWVAPELGDTIRAVNKLILGEAIKGGRYGEHRPALFPASLLASYPGERNPDPDSVLEQVKRRKPIRMIDGSVIELRYAGRGGALGDTEAASKKGGNLKGDAPAWIGVDEGAEIMSSSTWHTLIQRTTDSGGRLVTATTPKVGSPLKNLVYDAGKDLAANDGQYLTAYVHLSMLSNPWITPRNADTTIATLELEPNGADLVAQDVHGKWLVPGARMWEHFDEEAHVVDWPRRDLVGFRIDGRALVNITPIAAASFFADTPARLDRYGGQDFNGRGHCTVVVQIWCPEDLDISNQENWVCFVEDVVIKAGEPSEAARFLATQAGAMRCLPHDYFKGLAISCDVSGAQDRTAESATGNVQSMFTQCDEFVRRGFDMRPYHRSAASGKPVHVERLAKQAVLHRLMRRHDLGQSGPRYAAGEQGLPPSVRLVIRRGSCPELVKGLREQARNDHGFLRKRSDTRDDRISDPVDALLYALWPVFSDTLASSYEISYE